MELYLSEAYFILGHEPIELGVQYIKLLVIANNKSKILKKM